MDRKHIIKAGGFVKYYRNVFGQVSPNDVFELGLWAYIMLNVAWKPTPIWVGGKSIILEPGEMHVRVDQLALEMGVSRKRLDSALKRLESEKVIGRITGKNGTKILVNDYKELYGVQESSGKDEGRIEEGSGKDEGRLGEESGKDEVTIKPATPNSDAASDVPLELRSENPELRSENEERSIEEKKTLPESANENAEAESVSLTSHPSDAPPATSEWDTEPMHFDQESGTWDFGCYDGKTGMLTVVDEKPENPPPKKRKPRAPKEGVPAKAEDPAIELRRATWQAYETAYLQRWKTNPIRDMRANTAIKQFVDRVGKEAPAVIAHYVSMSSSYYVQQCHPLSLAVRDVQAIHTTWATGRGAISRQEAERQEISSANQQTLARLLAKK